LRVDYISRQRRWEAEQARSAPEMPATLEDDEADTVMVSGSPEGAYAPIRFALSLTILQNQTGSMRSCTKRNRSWRRCCRRWMSRTRPHRRVMVVTTKSTTLYSWTSLTMKLQVRAPIKMSVSEQSTTTKTWIHRMARSEDGWTFRYRVERYAEWRTCSKRPLALFDVPDAGLEWLCY